MKTGKWLSSFVKSFWRMDAEQQLKKDLYTLIERYSKEEGGDAVVLKSIYSAMKSKCL